MNTIIFESSDYNLLYPLNLTKPIYNLYLGTDTILNNYATNNKINIVATIPRRIFRKNDFLFNHIKRINKNEKFLFLNSQYIPDHKLNINFSKNTIYLYKDKLVAFTCTFSQFENMFSANGQIYDLAELDILNIIDSSNHFLSKEYLDGIYLEFPHQFNEHNYDFIIKSIKYKYLNNDKYIELNIDNYSYIEKKYPLLVGENIKIYKNVMFDTSQGPVIIDDGSIIKPFSIIEGPTYIGKNTLIENARIHGGTSILNVCKISGEIENSIINSYTNKHHDGFLGHAILGNFVNIGAMATNSDLKNNYSEIKISQLRKIRNTKSIKVGCFIGDHTKIGIGTLINSGTVIGAACNLYTDGGFLPSEVPSFCWGSKIPFMEYDLDKFYKTEDTVMKRRELELSEFDKEIYSNIFENNKMFRKRFL